MRDGGLLLGGRYGWEGHHVLHLLLLHLLLHLLELLHLGVLPGLLLVAGQLVDELALLLEKELDVLLLLGDHLDKELRVVHVAGVELLETSTCDRGRFHVNTLTLLLVFNLASEHVDRSFVVLNVILELNHLTVVPEFVVLSHAFIDLLFSFTQFLPGLRDVQHHVLERKVRRSLHKVSLAHLHEPKVGVDPLLGLALLRTPFDLSVLNRTHGLILGLWCRIPSLPLLHEDLGDLLFIKDRLRVFLEHLINTALSEVGIGLIFGIFLLFQKLIRRAIRAGLRSWRVLLFRVRWEILVITKVHVLHAVADVSCVVVRLGKGVRLVVGLPNGG